MEVTVRLPYSVVFMAPKKMVLNNIQVQVPRALLVTKADILDKKLAEVPTMHDPFLLTSEQVLQSLLNSKQCICCNTT